MAATYSPEHTQHKEAAIRCGLRLKFLHSNACNARLIDDTTGETRWEGLYWDSWEYMRARCGLQIGAH